MISTLTLLVGLTASAHAGKVTVPIDIGLGPAGHMITGPVQDDQALHTGLKVSVEAIINRKTIKKNRKKIPRQYRRYAKGLKEARISHFLIPDTLLISPKGSDNTGMMGIAWQPVQLGLPLLNAGIKVRVDLGLQL